MKLRKISKIAISMFIITLALASNPAYAEDPFLEEVKAKEGPEFWVTLSTWIIGLVAAISLIAVIWGIIRYITATGNQPLKDLGRKISITAGIIFGVCIIAFMIISYVSERTITP